MHTPMTENNTCSQVPFWSKMNVRMRDVAAGALMTALFSAVQAAEAPNEDLEPCMHGDVSASGTYASDAEEALARSRMENADPVQLALEPCINGEVSANGAFPTQELEDQFYSERNLEPRIGGDVSASVD